MYLQALAEIGYLSNLVGKNRTLPYAPLHNPPTCPSANTHSFDAYLIAFLYNRERTETSCWDFS